MDAMDAVDSMCLRPAEGVTTSKTTAVIKDVVIDDFAQSSADCAPSGGSKKSTQDGTADHTNEGTNRATE